MVIEAVAAHKSSVTENPTELSPGAVKPVKPISGYIAQMIPEVGDQTALYHHFDFVDTAYNSTWGNGGLFYPAAKLRADNLRPMDSLSGNVGMTYAKLNVFNGQRKMYKQPWTKDYFSTSAFIEIDLSSGVDFLRGTWNETLAPMAVTMRACCEEGKKVELHPSGLRRGKYIIFENRKLLGVYTINAKANIIQLKRRVTKDDLDIVIKRV
ncbi:hypothetical protein ACHAQD_011437 [Fusarium lateritium]